MVDLKDKNKSKNEDGDDGVDFTISTVKEEETIAGTTPHDTLDTQQEFPPRRRSGRNHPSSSISFQYESQDEEDTPSGRKDPRSKPTPPSKILKKENPPPHRRSERNLSHPIPTPHPYELLIKDPHSGRNIKSPPRLRTPPRQSKLLEKESAPLRRSGRNHPHPMIPNYESKVKEAQLCPGPRAAKEDPPRPKTPEEIVVERGEEEEDEKEKGAQRNSLEDEDDEPLQALASRLGTNGIKVKITLKKVKKDHDDKDVTGPQPKDEVETKQNAEEGNDEAGANNDISNDASNADDDDNSNKDDDGDDSEKYDNEDDFSGENSADDEDEDEWDPGDEDEDTDDDDEDDWNPTSKGKSGGVKRKKGNKGGGEGGVKRVRNKKERVKKERRSLSHLIIPEDREDGTKWYKCTMCEKGYSIRRSMYQHLREHRDKSLYFKCTLCAKEFAYEGGLTLHMRLHSEGEQVLFKCDRCDRSFVRKCDLEKHVVIHDESFKCRICDKEFDKIVLRRMHERRHNKERKFKCEICGKMLKERQSLIEHARTHSDVRPHACDMCEKAYKDKTSLLQHKRQKHTLEGLHYCDVCGKGYAIASDLKRHMDVHNPAREKPFQCPHCEKRFIQQKGMELHITSIHEQTRAFKCFICAKGYTDNSQLKRHLYQHSGKLPYVCDVCGKAFKEKVGLNKHCKTHENSTSIKTFMCAVKGCGKSYGYASSLGKHMRYCHPEGSEVEDKGTRIHKCPKCEKQSFLLTRGDYGFPENLHVKGYLCHICGAIITSEQGMLDHIIEKHS